MSVLFCTLKIKIEDMKKEEYLKLAEGKWEELEKLKEEKRFYEYEKRFEEIWIELGREVLQKGIGDSGKDRRVKKKILTRFGKIELKNSHPFSEIIKTFKVSPYLQDQIVYTSQKEVYSESSSTLNKLLRIKVSTSQC